MGEGGGPKGGGKGATFGRVTIRPLFPEHALFFRALHLCPAGFF